MLIRPTARVLALDPDNRVLLFRCDLDRVSWVPPGGGVEPGETFEEAALREFGEETGLSLARVGPCVMAVDDVGRYPDYGEQDIIFRCQTFLVRLTASDVALLDPGMVQQAGHGGHRWWSLPALEQTDADIFPRGLATIVRGLLSTDGADSPGIQSLAARLPSTAW